MAVSPISKALVDAGGNIISSSGGYINYKDAFNEDRYFERNIQSALNQNASQTDKNLIMNWSKVVDTIAKAIREKPDGDDKNKSFENLAELVKNFSNNVKSQQFNESGKGTEALRQFLSSIQNGEIHNLNLNDISSSDFNVLQKFLDKLGETIGPSNFTVLSLNNIEQALRIINQLTDTSHYDKYNRSLENIFNTLKRNKDVSPFENINETINNILNQSKQLSTDFKEDKWENAQLSELEGQYSQLENLTQTVHSLSLQATQLFTSEDAKSVSLGQMSNTILNFMKIAGATGNSISQFIGIINTNNQLTKSQKETLIDLCKKLAEENTNFTNAFAVQLDKQIKERLKVIKEDRSSNLAKIANTRGMGDEFNSYMNSIGHAAANLLQSTYTFDETRKSRPLFGFKPTRAMSHMRQEATILSQLQMEYEQASIDLDKLHSQAEEAFAEGNLELGNRLLATYEKQFKSLEILMKQMGSHASSISQTYQGLSKQQLESLDSTFKQSIQTLLNGVSENARNLLVQSKALNIKVGEHHLREFSKLSDQFTEFNKSIEETEKQSENYINNLKQSYNSIANIFHNLQRTGQGILSTFGLGSIALGPLSTLIFGHEYHVDQSRRRYASMSVGALRGVTDINSISELAQQQMMAGNELYRISGGRINQYVINESYQNLMRNVSGIPGTSPQQFSNDMAFFAKETALLQNVYGVEQSTITSGIQTFYRDMRMSADQAVNAMAKLTQEAISSNVPIDQYLSTINAIANQYMSIGIAGEKAGIVLNNLTEHHIRLDIAKEVASQLGQSLSSFSQDKNKVAFSAVISGQNPWEALAGMAYTHDRNGDPRKGFVDEAVALADKYTNTILGAWGNNEDMRRIGLTDIFRQQFSMDRRTASMLASDYLQNGNTEQFKDKFQESIEKAENPNATLEKINEEALKNLEKMSLQLADSDRLEAKLKSNIFEEAKNIGNRIDKILNELSPLLFAIQGTILEVTIKIVDWLGKLFTTDVFQQAKAKIIDALKYLPLALAGFFGVKLFGKIGSFIWHIIKALFGPIAVSFKQLIKNPKNLKLLSKPLLAMTAVGALAYKLSDIKNFDDLSKSFDEFGDSVSKGIDKASDNTDKNIFDTSSPSSKTVTPTAKDYSIYDQTVKIIDNTNFLQIDKQNINRFTNALNEFRYNLYPENTDRKEVQLARYMTNMANNNKEEEETDTDIDTNEKIKNIIDQYKNKKQETIVMGASENINFTTNNTSAKNLKSLLAPMSTPTIEEENIDDNEILSSSSQPQSLQNIYISSFINETLNNITNQNIMNKDIIDKNITNQNIMNKNTINKNTSINKEITYKQLQQLLPSFDKHKYEHKQLYKSPIINQYLSLFSDNNFTFNQLPYYSSTLSATPQYKNISEKDIDLNLDFPRVDKNIDIYNPLKQLSTLDIDTNTNLLTLQQVLREIAIKNDNDNDKKVSIEGIFIEGDPFQNNPFKGNLLENNNILEDNNVLKDNNALEDNNILKDNSSINNLLDKNTNNILIPIKTDDKVENTENADFIDQPNKQDIYVSYPFQDILINEQQIIENNNILNQEQITNINKQNSNIINIVNQNESNHYNLPIQSIYMTNVIPENQEQKEIYKHIVKLQNQYKNLYKSREDIIKSIDNIQELKDEAALQSIEPNIEENTNKDIVAQLIEKYNNDLEQLNDKLSQTNNNLQNVTLNLSQEYENYSKASTKNIKKAVLNESNAFNKEQKDIRRENIGQNQATIGLYNETSDYVAEDVTDKYEQSFDKINEVDEKITNLEKESLNDVNSTIKIINSHVGADTNKEEEEEKEEVEIEEIKEEDKDFHTFEYDSNGYIIINENDTPTVKQLKTNFNEQRKYMQQLEEEKNIDNDEEEKNQFLPENKKKIDKDIIQIHDQSKTSQLSESKSKSVLPVKEQEKNMKASIIQMQNQSQSTKVVDPFISKGESFKDNLSLNNSVKTNLPIKAKKDTTDSIPQSFANIYGYNNLSSIADKKEEIIVKEKTVTKEKNNKAEIKKDIVIQQPSLRKKQKKDLTKDEKILSILNKFDYEKIRKNKQIKSIIQKSKDDQSPEKKIKKILNKHGYKSNLDKSIESLQQKAKTQFTVEAKNKKIKSIIEKFKPEKEEKVLGISEEVSPFEPLIDDKNSIEAKRIIHQERRTQILKNDDDNNEKEENNEDIKDTKFSADQSRQKYAKQLQKKINKEQKEQQKLIKTTYNLLLDAMQMDESILSDLQKTTTKGHNQLLKMIQVTHRLLIDINETLARSGALQVSASMAVNLLGGNSQQQFNGGGHYGTSADITFKRNYNKNEMLKSFQSRIKDFTMADVDKVITIAEKHGIDPAFFAAALILEGGSKFNMGNVENYAGGSRFADFSSMEEGLEASAAAWAKETERAGTPNIWAAAEVYAPRSENQSYVYKVLNIMKEYTDKSHLNFGMDPYQNYLPDSWEKLRLPNMTLYQKSSPIQNFSSSSPYANIESAVAWAENVARDNTHGYSQGAGIGSYTGSRDGPDYDCSSFIYHALQQGGNFNVIPQGQQYSGDGYTLFDDLLKVGGWQKISYNQAKNNLQRGDILVSDNHVAFYAGNNKTVEAIGVNGSRGGSYETGDQGGEIDFYNAEGRGWTEVYRYIPQYGYISQSSLSPSSLSQQQQQQQIQAITQQRTKKKVFINPGHSPVPGPGQTERGAEGLYGLIEGEQTQLISNLVAQKLEKAGVDVQVFQFDDGGTTEHVISTIKQKAEQVNPDLFISLHFNANGPQPGIEGYYRNEPGNQANKIMLEEIAKITGLQNLGSKHESLSNPGSLGVLSNNYPSTLLELGFIDNPHDAQFIKNNPDLLATAVAQGILKQLNTSAATTNQYYSGDINQLMPTLMSQNLSFISQGSVHPYQHYLQSLKLVNDPNSIIASGKVSKEIMEQHKRHVEEINEQFLKEQEEDNEIEENHKKDLSIAGIKYNKKDIKSLQDLHPDWDKDQIYTELDKRPEYGLSNKDYLALHGITITNPNPILESTIANNLREGRGPNGKLFEQADINKLKAEGKTQTEIVATLAADRKYGLQANSPFNKFATKANIYMSGGQLISSVNSIEANGYIGLHMGMPDMSYLGNASTMDTFATINYPLDTSKPVQQEEQKQTFKYTTDKSPIELLSESYTKQVNILQVNFETRLKDIDKFVGDSLTTFMRKYKQQHPQAAREEIIKAAQYFIKKDVKIDVNLKSVTKKLEQLIREAFGPEFTKHQAIFETIIDYMTDEEKIYNLISDIENARQRPPQATTEETPTEQVKREKQL